MSEPFIGEIKMFGGNFAPRSYALCDGQLLSINQNQALFAILGTIYGGDGRSTFALPDLRGRIPIGAGQGPGLPNHPQGQQSGEENVTMAANQLPLHNHTMMGSTQAANIDVPTNAVPAITGGDSYNDGGVPVSMLETTTTGGGQSHANLMPFNSVNYIIALFGLFPSRN